MSISDIYADPNAETKLKPEDEGDLVAIIKTRRDKAHRVRADWIDASRECYDFVAGQQWSPEDRQTLKEQLRPAVVFNRVGPVIDVVSGLEVSNRQETRYIPRQLGAAAVNELYTGAGQWVRDECNAEDEESESFLDMAICGEGWTETRLDYEYDPDGAILIERVDPIELLPDPSSRRKNYIDADYLVREKLVDPAWLKATWPDKEDEIEALQELTDEEREELPGHTVRVAGDQYQSPWGFTPSPDKKQLKLVEYQEKKRESYYRVADPTTGKVAELSVQEFRKVSAMMDKAGMTLQAVKQVRCKFYRGFLVGDILLEYKLCPDPTSFTYKAMTAKRDRNLNQWFGIVRGMIDPQRWANKWLSQSMHILNSNAKGGVMYEETAVDKPSEFEKSWSDPRSATKVRDGAIAQNRIQPKVPPPFPQGFSDLMQFAIQSIRDVSGVSVELLGMTDRDQPAALELTRKQSGITILATLFDALRKYRKEQGKMMLYLIMTYISDGRLIRINGKEMQQYVPLTKVPDIERYDIIVDDAPSSPNQKERVWAILQQLLPMMAQMGIQPPQAVVDYLPLPQSLIDKVKQPNPEQAQKAKQQEELTMRDRAADIGLKEAQAIKAKSDAQVSAAKVQSEMAKTEAQRQTELAQVQADADLKASQARLNDANAAKAMAEVNATGETGDQVANQLKAMELQLASRELDIKAADTALKDKQMQMDFHIESKKLEQQKELSKADAENQYKVATVKNGGIDGETHAKTMEDVSSKLDGLAEALTKPKKVLRDAKGKISGWTHAA